MSIKEEAKRARAKSRTTGSHGLFEGAILDPRVQAVIHFMNANLHRKLSLARLADVGNLSPSRLSHLFKAETGLPPVEFLIRLRMERAAHLLATTRLSIKQVMAAVGYDNGSNFIRHFRAQFQLAPSEYRSEISLQDRV